MLIDTTNGRDYQDLLKDVLEVYNNDLKELELKAQLESFRIYFKQEKRATIADIVERLRKMSKLFEDFFPQVKILIKFC